jgi:signal transduction histidine kinase
MPSQSLIAVMGPSGCGKSTLLKALNGDAPATSGKVFIGGLDLEKNYDYLKTQIGYVPQDDIVHAELTVEQSLFYAAKLRLAHADDTIVKEKIEQVLINLIVNSIKYGKDKGTTEVGIEQLTKNLLLVRIKDDGEGIAPQHIPRLFERFFRVDTSGSRDAGGSGLGLSIVKHIIEAHEQKIYVESEPGMGSEFSFTIKKAQ